MRKTLACGCIGHPLSFAEAAEAAARCGFEGYWFDIVKDSMTPAQETKALLRRHHLTGEGFGLPVNFREEEDTYRRDMEQLPLYVDYARQIGLTRCVTWVLPASDTLSFDENFERHRRRLAPAARMLGDHGIRLGLEFLGPTRLRDGHRFPFIHTLPGMLSLCEAIGTGNCGILADVWHWDLAGQTFEDFRLFTHPDQIVCAHIMDAPAGVPPEDQDDHFRGMPGSTGVLRMAEFFRGLSQVGYDGPVVAEPFQPFLAALPFEEALALTMASINRVWPE